MKEVRELKEKAAEAFAKGKFAKAAELYEQYCAGDPKDLQARLRMGDAFVRTGDREKAIHAYQTAAEGFAQSGFLPRAIAASKLILELDPSHTGVQSMLADLYARRGASGPEGRSQPLESLGPSLQYFGPRASSHGRVIELPPEEPEMVLESNSVTAPPAPQQASKGVPAAPAAAPPPDEGPDIDFDVDVEEAPAAPAAPAAVAPVASAPPGLRPKRSPAPEAPPAAPPVPAAPAAARGADAPDFSLEIVGPGSPSTFTELEMEGDSLLHAVELAAESALAQKLGDSPKAPDPDPAAEEVVFSSEDLTEPAQPQALPKIPLFSDLSHEAFIELFDRCPLRRFPLGAIILQQGSQGSSFFVICEGSVRVFREEGAQRKDLAILQDGAFFGEMALLSGAPRTASVESASDETQLLELSAQVLAELSHRYPPVAQALKKFCRQRLLQNVMSTSALFEPFSRKDRKQLIERFRARDVPRNTVLIREGDRSDGLYVLLSGEVEVRKEQQMLARLKEGEIFGEMSLLQKTPATATVVATRRTSLLRLPREDFDELILSHPQILILVSELTEDRHRHTEAVLGGAAAPDKEKLLLV